jgi:hypothetical protein
MTFKRAQWFRQATRKEENDFVHSAARKGREKHYFDKQEQEEGKQRYILKREVPVEVGGGGRKMELTEDNVQWSGFSISGVLIPHCYLFMS